jgi:hypothetical protein
MDKNEKEKRNIKNYKLKDFFFMTFIYIYIFYIKDNRNSPLIFKIINIFFDVVD